MNNDTIKHTALGNAKAALAAYKDQLAAIPSTKAAIAKARATGEVPADHEDPADAMGFGAPTVEQYIAGLETDLESMEKCVAGFEETLVELLFAAELEKQDR